VIQLDGLLICIPVADIPQQGQVIPVSPHYLALLVEQWAISAPSQNLTSRTEYHTTDRTLMGQPQQLFACHRVPQAGRVVGVPAQLLPVIVPHHTFSTTGQNTLPIWAEGHNSDGALVTQAK
jgi:hypothetical protein